MSDDIERIARAWYARFHAKNWDDQSAASRQFMVHATEELVASARDALGLTASDLAGLAEGTHVVVPVEHVRHYKGGAYKVFGRGHHTETLERLVGYRRDSDGTWWFRPERMFEGERSCGMTTSTT